MPALLDEDDDAEECGNQPVHSSLSHFAAMALSVDEDDKGPTTFVIQDNGLLTSLDTVLMQEMVKFNRLMTNMSSSLVY